MKILLINQTFYPDTSAVSQQLTDLVCRLTAKCHEVTVLTGNHKYEDPSVKLPKRESHHGAQVIRIPYSACGRLTKLRRFIDFITFHLSLLGRILVLPKQDCVISMTLPPFVGLWGGMLRRFKQTPHIHWGMDLNPDEAFASGWLKEKSLWGRFFANLTGWIFGHCDKIVALDRFMEHRIIERYGITPEKIRVIPPWAHDDCIAGIEHKDNPFRKEYSLGDKFVVMYSGNHSICHSLDTLLESALRLQASSNIIFVFIGGGVRAQQVKDFKLTHGLKNILQIPTQPMENLSQSLSAADLHVTVMGNDYVGIVHPCKIYGILSTGRPFLYIGPAQSPTGDLIKKEQVGYQAEHGDVNKTISVIECVRSLNAAEKEIIRQKSLTVKDTYFSQALLSAELIGVIETINE